MAHVTEQLADQVAPLVFPHPARILDAARAAADAEWRVSEDRLLALAKKAAPDPSIFGAEDRQPYFWPAEISNGRLDSYYTRMGITSLKRYATDAKGGVAILPGHDHRTLPYGYTLTGEFFKADASDAESARVVAYSYMVRGMILAGVSTNDVIDGIRAGILRDVSIGFHGGEYICGICGRDMMRDWECRHWPGIEYAVVEEYDEKTGKPKVSGEKILCTATIEGAGLSEVSHVYDGATPSAMILRAEFAVAERLIKPETVDLLEARYRARLPRPARQFAGVDVPPSAAERKAGEMPPENTNPTPEPQLTERKAGEPTPAPLVSDPAPALRALLDAAKVQEGEQDLVSRVRFLVAEIERLRPLADDGKAWKDRLVADTVEQGIRAFGGDFKPEAEKADLALLPVAAIERRKEAYQRIADKAIPTGRSTTEDQPELVDGSATLVGGNDRAHIPVTAYRV